MEMCRRLGLRWAGVREWERALWDVCRKLLFQQALDEMLWAGTVRHDATHSRISLGATTVDITSHSSNFHDIQGPCRAQ